MRLSDLQTGEKGIITKVNGRGAFRRRITEMGFLKGKKVSVVKNAPLKDPIEYRLLDFNISLRRNEASLIEVTTPKDYLLQNACFSLVRRTKADAHTNTLANEPLAFHVSI